MPDYGHPLRFGTLSFIQPSNAQPALTVTLAERSEAGLGYDLVTFQDQPRLPAGLPGHVDAEGGARRPCSQPATR